MSAQINTIIRQTQRHHFDDGLTELFIGALGLLGSMVLLLPNSPLQAAVWFIIGVVVISYIQEWLRQRFVYPRSGYVTYREHKSQKWKSLLGAAIAAVLVMVLLGIAIYLDFERAFHWVSPIVGGFIGTVFLWKGIQLRLIRLIILGIYSLLVGMAFSPLVSTPERTGWYNGILYFGAYLLIFGIGVTFSGGLRFWRHLRANPDTAEAP